MNRIGIDLGGTKIEGVLLDDHHNVIKRERVLTERENGYHAIVEKIVGLTQSLIKLGEAKGPIGICTPGAIDPTSGSLKNSNTICLIGQPLREDLEKALGVSVLMENDANCFALAEATMGVAKGYGVVFGVILGTGCGGGVVINEKIHSGPNRISGEWGHHVLYPDGVSCYCGNKGCTERYISGTALENQWKELTGEFQYVTDIIDKKLYLNHPEWKKKFILNFGRALANVIDILDPDAIVIGGGVSKVDLLYTEGKESVYREAFSEQVVTPIFKNQLGDAAGVYGAAMLGDIL
ncbi:ROK family protein [Caldithrix abyssi]|nr:ROK family protein [Caldithrix abyssi]